MGVTSTLPGPLINLEGVIPYTNGQKIHNSSTVPYKLPNIEGKGSLLINRALGLITFFMLALLVTSTFLLLTTPTAPNGLVSLTIAQLSASIG